MLNVVMMKFRKTRLGMAAAMLGAGLALSGCVVYPNGYAYNTYGYAPAYAPPVYIAPPVVTGSFFFGGGGWGGRRWR